jgi:hypothetical protein
MVAGRLLTFGCHGRVGEDQISLSPYTATRDRSTMISLSFWGLDFVALF